MEGSSSTSAASDSRYVISPDGEESILKKLQDCDSSVREKRLLILKIIAGEFTEFKISVCSQRILEVVISNIQPHHSPNLIREATSFIDILSEEPSNRTKIAQFGIIPPLVAVLKNFNIGLALARDHAARALSYLALEESNKEAIGSSTGALSALLDQFCEPGGNYGGREYAGKALSELTFNSPGNVARLLDIAGAVPKLLALMEDQANNFVAGEFGALAMMVVSHLAWEWEGRKALVEAGAVGRMVRMMREGTSTDEGSCLDVMYQIQTCDNNQSLFKSLAIEAGAEDVLSQDKEKWGEVGRDMAKKMLDFIKKGD